jgi:hypothetical protein
MERLNYFNPYESKGPEHEDQLTRAYLVLLKHSSHAFFTFFEYCRNKLELDEQKQTFSILEYIETGWTFDTQKNNPKIETDYLLSILITNEKTKCDPRVSSINRNARYDGIITFGEKLTMIIENKPQSTHVWFDQLNPSRKSLPEDIIIYENPIILEWKEIIRHLNSLLSISTISGYEKIMIDDFLAFVDENFSALNPYDNFSLCKNNENLIRRRIQNILKSIAHILPADPHPGWGHYIYVPFDQIKKIGLILKKDENNWKLNLELFFGNTQNQAKSFYESKPEISKLCDLKADGWFLESNFHMSYVRTNLVWFESEMSIEKYIKYWIKHIDLIKQKKRDEVEEFLNFLKENKVIVYDDNKKNEIKDILKNRETLNICPEFYMSFSISSKEAMEKDAIKNGKASKLMRDISNKFKEALSSVNLPWKGILKDEDDIG